MYTYTQWNISFATDYLKKKTNIPPRILVFQKALVTLECSSVGALDSPPLNCCVPTFPAIKSVTIVTFSRIKQYHVLQ